MCVNWKTIRTVRRNFGFEVERRLSGPHFVQRFSLVPEREERQSAKFPENRYIFSAKEVNEMNFAPRKVSKMNLPSKKDQIILNVFGKIDQKVNFSAKERSCSINRNFRYADKLRSQLVRIIGVLLYLVMLWRWRVPLSLGAFCTKGGTQGLQNFEHF